MANQLTGWLLVLVGLVWTLPFLGVGITNPTQSLVTGIAFLIMGIAKLVRIYK
ncbi:MAG: hypothetical protein ABEI74_03075 [Candidatus Pacearchaeota archaeon]